MKTLEHIHTTKDVLNEAYSLDAELDGAYDFPMLAKCTGNPKLLSNSVVFKDANKCSNPRETLCHFFEHDCEFERIWTNAEQYVDMLNNFKFVVAPDFSCYSDMPMALQIYNVYRSRAVGNFLWQRGVNIIPCVTWSDEKSYDWCFDGLPQNSILAVSTNGCRNKEAQEYYRKGFKEMCKRLNPYKVVVVGNPIDVDVDVEIIYFKSFGQQMNERLANGRT